MLLQLIKFEFKYQSRQLAFWVFSIAFLFFGWMVGRGIYAPENVIYNSPYNIAKYTTLFSLAIVFAIMFQAVSGALRDQQFKFSDLLYSTTLQKRDYFLSRYIGVFVFSLFVMSLGMLGVVISASTAVLDTSEGLTIYWLGFLKVWGLIIVPTVFVMTALIFAVSVYTKNVLATYVTAIFIYALYWLCAIFLNSPMLAQSVPADPGNLFIAALADPFGLSAFFEQTQYWTAYEQSYSIDFFSGSLRWNRILWGLFAFSILFLIYRITSFQYKDVKRKEQLKLSEEKTPGKVYRPKAIEINSWNFSWQTFKSLLKIDVFYILKSWPFLGGVILWGIIVFIEVYTRVNAGGGYSERIYPSTGYLIELIREPLPFIALLLIVFYGGELIWRSRNIKSFLMLDATPTSNIAFFLSKIFTLCFIPIILITVGILIAIGFQIAYGYYHLELGLYLGMFYFDSVRPFLYILLVVFVQTIFNNKYLGMFASILIIILLGTSLSIVIGVEHPMLRLNRLPNLMYNQFSGYGDYVRPFNYYSFYWIVFGLMLGMISFSFWRRGMLESYKIRFQKAVHLQSKATYAFWSVTGVLFLIAGSNLWFYIHFDQEYKNTNTQLNIQEQYEKKYKKYEELLRLQQVDVRVEVDLYPVERKYDFSASYTLENKNSTPVKTVLLSERERLSKVIFEKAKLIGRDSLLSAWLYELKDPLLPGEQVQLTFEINKTNAILNPPRDLVENGSFLLLNNVGPVLGYRSSREIRDSKERAHRNLPPKTEEKVDVLHLHTGDATIGKIPYSAIISTDADQVALSPGDLVRTWTEGEREYFEYKTQENVVPLLGLVSGRYAVKKDNIDGVLLEQYYLAAHPFNIDDIKKYTEATLKYCNEEYGQYPFDHLRIIEIPGHWPFGGIAMPGMILMVEDRLYTVDVSDDQAFNLVAKRTIHEVSHQWWGHLLMAKNVAGGSLFVEGFAKYTEAVMMEKIFGKWSLMQLGKTANQRYFSERSMSSEKEPPLYLSDAEGYLAYGKMYTVMLAMKNLLGEDTVNKIMRDLVEKHRPEITPRVISTDLIASFYEVTPAEYHTLIDDWFKKVINYDLKIEDTQVEKMEDGRYEVVIDVHAKRMETLVDGSEKEIAINEPILIGLFPDDPENVQKDEAIIYLEPHLINVSTQQVRVVVNEKPAVVAIDPYLSRTDKNWVDNYKELD